MMMKGWKGSEERKSRIVSERGWEGGAGRGAGAGRKPQLYFDVSLPNIFTDITSFDMEPQTKDL